MEVLKDFPPGPLDVYRKKSSFNWQKMKILLEGEDMIRLQHKLWNTLESDPLFSRPYGEEEVLSLQDYRRLAYQRIKRYQEYKILESDPLNYVSPVVLYLSLGMYDWSLAIKSEISKSLCVNSLRIFGTERHQKYLDQAAKLKIQVCFALTELAHGSNAKQMETKATYDPETQEFVLHSPRNESMKFWVGNLGQCATYTILYAQLYTPDGECHGLHLFVVPIRDENTQLPYNGVTIGDLGPKVGLNGMDNGFLSFNNYRIPRENLLNRHCDVSVDGKYLTTVKNPRKRFSESVSSLSMGRVVITRHGASILKMCMAIAIRYSATRKQFGPSEGQELPVLEYQTQQWRLLPYLAATYVLTNYTTMLYNSYMEFIINYTFSEKTPQMREQAAEYHALSCASKSVVGWITRDAVQECREACGGHGYLSAAGLGRLRNDNDANCTYEGDNNLILQQTSNYLLGIYERLQKDNPDISHLKTLDFMKNTILEKEIAVHKVDDLLNMKVILQMFSWVVHWLLEKSSRKFQSCLAEGWTTFDARNSSQAYHCRSLSISYAEHSILQTFNNFLHEITDNQLHIVLHKIGCLYGLWSLQKYLPALYEGNYCPRFLTSLVQDAILKLCLELKDDAVALADALAPPDFILYSVLGKSDGQLYKNLNEEVVNAPGAQVRPFWWRELLEKPSPNSLQCKM